MSQPKVVSRFPGIQAAPRHSCAIVAADLSPLESSVLAILVAHRGIPMTHEAIRAAFAPATPPATAMIDVCILRLRQKLAATPAYGQVYAVPGRGYLVAEAGRDLHPSQPPLGRLSPALQPLLCG